jgi:hypothetical protein
VPTSHGVRQVRLLHAKQSSAALLLEGKANLLRLLQEIPLGETEQAAVEDGLVAYGKLLMKIAGHSHASRTHSSRDKLWSR